MNRKRLLAALQRNGDDIVLRTDTPELLHLGIWLSDVIDQRGELVIHRMIDVDADADAPEGNLVITGQVTVLNMPAVQVKAVFVLEDDEVDHFYLLIRLPPAWRLLQSFTDLPNSTGGVSFVDDYHFIDPILVVSARAQVITDAEYKLDAEVFENGLNLFASGLADPLLLGNYGLSHFPAGAEMARKPPEIIKALINRTPGMTSIKMLCWWQAGSGEKIGGAPVRRMGIGFQSITAAAAETAPNVLWFWEVQIHPDEQSFVVIASLPREDSEPPIYQVLFESAQFLKSGASALTALTDGNDPTDILPFKDGPLISLASLTFTPGAWVGVQFVLMDRTTHKPYVWAAIDDWLTLEDIRLSVLATLKPEVSYEIDVRGIADIEGYQFEVEVVLDSQTPGKVESVRGALYNPHEIDLEAFITKLFGHGVDCPNLQLKLLAAEYSNDISSNTKRYGVTVGGHIDLLGNGAFLLESVGFEIESTGGQTTRKHLAGTISLVNTPIRVAADYQEGDGWTFEGSANPYQGIALTGPDGLVNDLVHRAGLAIPAGLPEVTLTEFGLSFGGKRKLFRIWGRATWKPPEDAELPWFSGEVETVVDISSSVNPQTTVRETDFDLLWLYTSGDRTFQATANHSHDGNAFFITWDGGANEKPLGFHELHDLLHLGEVFSLPDGEGWKIFEFSRLLVGYQSDPRLIQLMAASRLGAGELTFDAAFAKNSRSISASWTGDNDTDSLGIDDLLQAVDLSAVIQLPGSIGKDIFDFHKLSFKYVGGMQPSLQFVGEAADAFYQDLFLVMLKGSAGWGFVAGIAFKDRTKLSDIPGIGVIPGLDTALDFLSIDPVYLLFSTTDADNFIPPVADVGANSTFAVAPTNPRQFNTPKTAIGAPAASQRRYKLKADTATIAARILFEDSDNPVLSTRSDLIKIKELDARITVGSEFDVLALLPGQLEIPAGGGESLKLSNAFFGMGVTSMDVITFQVGGQTIFNLFGETRTVEARMIVNEEAAVATVHLQNVPLPPIHALPGVRFKEQDLYLEMGVQFEPPGFDMGFMGDFYIGDNPDKYTGKAIFVLELVEGVPNPLYVQFLIDSLTLWAMFEAMTGTMARIDDAESGLKLLDASGATQAMGAAGVSHGAEGALEFLKQQYKNLQFVFDKVSLNDVALHWADSIVILPDGTTAMPGVGFRGWLDLFGWHTFGSFEFSISSPTKFSAHLELEPIDLQHIISITGDGKGVLKREAQGLAEAWENWKDDGQSKATALLKPAQITPDYVIKPGGPVLIVSSEHAPFLHANLHVAIFDLLHLDVTANVDENGISFELTTGVGTLITLTLGCKLRVKDGFRFEAYGKFALHLNADLSFKLPPIGEIPIVLDAGLDAEIHLTVTDKEFSLSIDGSFEFEGIGLTLPTLTILAPFPSFGDLPEKILDHIKAMAKEIFGDLFGELGELAGEAVKTIRDAAKAVGEEVEKIGEEVVKDVKVIGESVEKAFNAVEESVEEAAAEIKAGAKVVEDAAKEAVYAFKEGATKVVDELAHDAAQVLDGAKQVAGIIGDAVTVEVSKIGDAMVDIANEAEHEIVQIGEGVVHVVNDILDTATRVADEMVNVAETVADGIEQTAKVVWAEANAIANEIERELEEAANAVAHGFEDAGEAIGSIY